MRALRYTYDRSGITRLIAKRSMNIAKNSWDLHIELSERLPKY